MSDLPSSVQRLIDHFSKLPGIGPKSSARMVFHLLHSPESYTTDFSKAIGDMKQNISFCSICHNLAENQDICSICSSEERSQNEILVVEDVLDLFAFERIGEYKGSYHVLGGVISPVQGIGPAEINLDSLFSRIRGMKVDTELIIATNPTLEGEATGMYIKDELEEISTVKITRIARGVPTGADLDYADRMTLKRALQGRTDL